MSRAPIRLPSVPAAPDRSPFPIFASAAPVIASLLIWLITGSPFAILFAVLGPVVAIAAVLDSKRRGRKSERLAELRFRRKLDAVRQSITDALAQEREQKLNESLIPNSFGEARASTRSRSGVEDIGDFLIYVGIGRTRSGVRVESNDDFDNYGSELQSMSADLLRAAEWLEDGPRQIRASEGICIAGIGPRAVALAGAILAQCAMKLDESNWKLEMGAALLRELPWASKLPHFESGIEQPVPERTGDELQFEFQSRNGKTPPISVQIIPSRQSVRKGMLLDLSGSHSARIEVTGRREVSEFLPCYFSAAEGWLLASQLSTEASATAGGFQQVDRLPLRVSFSDLEVRSKGRLSAAIGMGKSGQFEVDLGIDGPHAIVAGTTGSGKSELLITWLLGMAAERPPSELNFLLVDFKGGSTFAELSELRHVTGVITDLDSAEAERVLLSLRAELRFREEFLLREGARSFEDLEAGGTASGSSLARLVIVVDEFATLLSDYPGLHELFTDIAARGRSLGIHLILCTQRPSGSIRESILANCNLRICLRVNSREDSISVLGASDAAQLERGAVGRSIVRSGNAPELVQIALSNPSEIRRLVERYSTDPEPRRPWLNPLPVLIPIEQLDNRDSVAGVFGLSDVPENQSRCLATYSPRDDGNMAVVGAKGSGKSTALRSIHGSLADSIWVESSIESVWDEVHRALESLRSGHLENRILIFDDLDVTLGQLGSEHRAALLDSLSSLSREGTRRGVGLAFSTCTLDTSLLRVADCSLVLRIRDRHDFIALTGSPDGFDPRSPSGRGVWRGMVTQVAVRGDSTRPQSGHNDSVPSNQPAQVDESAPLAVVSGSPSALREFLRVSPSSAGGLSSGQADHYSDGVPIADPEEWNANWSRFSELRRSGPVLFHNCSLGDFRNLSRSRVLPPPLADSTESGWLLDQNGRVSRLKFSTLK